MLNRIIRCLAGILMTATLLAGCDTLDQPEAILKLKSSEIEISGAGDETDIYFTASSKWTVEITEGQDWLSISPKEGDGSSEEQKAVVSASRNKEAKARVGKIEFSMSGAQSQILSVTQNAEEESEFSLSKKKLNFEAEGGEEKIKLTAPGAWHVDLGDADWINVSPSKGKSAANKSITIEADKNKDTEDRSATIKFILDDEDDEISLTVRQEGANTGNSEMTLSSSSLTFDCTGSTKSLTVTCGEDWTVSMEPEVDWLVVDPSEGKGTSSGKTVNVSVVTNNQGERTADLIFATASESKRVTVTQECPVEPGPYFIGVKINDDYMVSTNVKYTNNYGYLYMESSLATDGYSGYSDQVFTFATVEGGYTIQDPAGRYYCMNGGYNSFNMYDSLPENGGVWTIMKNEDGTFVITDAYNGMCIQYDAQYSSVGAYLPGTLDGLYPALARAENAEQRPENPAIECTVMDILNGTDNQYYTCTGYITSIVNTTYGNWYLKDYSGEVYIYGTLDAEGKTKNFLSLGLNEGDIVKITGPKLTYKSSTEMVDVTVEAHYPVTDISISDFLNAEQYDKYYRLTGTIRNIKNTTYGNFDLVDDYGNSVYVYGLVSGYGGPKKMFGELGLNEGDTITLVGNPKLYNGVIQVANAFYVSRQSSPDQLQ